MKVFVGLVIIGILSVTVSAQPREPGTTPTSTEANAAPILTGRAEFELAVKTADTTYEHAKMRYKEATERARLNYIKLLEDNLDDLDDEDTRSADYQKELTRVRALTLRSPKYDYTMYRWEHNAPPVKMIHKDEGFCYIADVGGAFNGGAEVARVYIGDDGYWYVSGSTGHGFLVVSAMAVKIDR